MKTNILKFVALAIASVTLLVSCGDKEKDTNKPVVNLTEVGHENSKIAHRGNDMHLEANIVAEKLIKRIDVEIHQEDGGKFKIEKSYTDGKYIGVKNTNFHEHIDIPMDAPLGKYHLHFTVTDKEGQTVTKGVKITMEEHSEEHHDHHEK